MAGSYKKGEAVRNGGGNRRKGAPNLDRLQMEAVLVDTLLDTPHNFRFVNSPTDGGEFLAQMSKAIAEAPFKRRRAEPQFSWFAEADSARPVKVDREQRGLRRLWAEQLRQLPGGSLEAAQAVADVYPSPQALIKAYAACLSEQERQALVADLPIRRTVGPLVSSRRVGKEMSRKLYLVMSSTDGATEI
ncbi:crossover junction endonuclease EME1-like [Pollicipes pollicipes]|uniref:crossover junction endonuclease EME1-like n=1 Tax=Pollicipes pollicipes TaxID=41117 RepID=UPI001884E92F|nr:crossover junction endonuclease EME1-like [Pollicipes pollicipes]